MNSPKASLARGLLTLACVLFFVVGSGLALSVLTGKGGRLYFGDGIPALTMMLAAVGFVTFFGFLSLPTAGGEVGQLTEPRMRIALTAALVLTYLVYFSVAVWRADAGDDLSMELLETLTSMIMVVLPFYFGVTGAVEIARTLSPPSSPDKKQDATDPPAA